MTRILGKRQSPPITLHASADALREGARFNDEIHKLPTGDTCFIPKGIFRFRSHAEANRHWEECVARGMAEVARRRAGG